MVKRNKHFAKLNAGYLFPEIQKRKKALLERYPHARMISLGIGDTTEPIPPHITEGLKISAEDLGTSEKYSGYGPEQGNPLLRQKIAKTLYQDTISPDEIFISDGSKSDIGRLQLLFGADASIAVQDPSYPVYVDTGVMMGQTEGYDPSCFQYRGISYMPCLPSNRFFPNLNEIPRTDLIYFCSPNNPTGAVATKEQLLELVNYARHNHSILIFDAAYTFYIRGSHLPRSIYEIEGAREVAIELGSFSKMAGFTGIRLGWSIVPDTLGFEGGFSIQKDWKRVVSTFFNGASNIAQMGGIAALDAKGLQEIRRVADFYMENAQILRSALEELGYLVYGGTEAPYLWVEFPGRKSWDVFEEILEKAHVVSTPGSGFGPAGEGFLRFSAYGHRRDIEEAVHRLRKIL
jgi:LL-diaminopimelate aminotransferase